MFTWYRTIRAKLNINLDMYRRDIESVTDLRREATTYKCQRDEAENNVVILRDVCQALMSGYNRPLPNSNEVMGRTTRQIKRNADEVLAMSDPGSLVTAELARLHQENWTLRLKKDAGRIKV